MNITAYELAQRYVGIRELGEPGKDHPLIQWWLSLCAGFGVESPDQTPWCSAFVNGICWELRLPRSKSAMARSWLGVGVPVAVFDPVRQSVGFDVVILKRGAGDQAGPEVRDAPGHVGFFGGIVGGNVNVLGGNQGNAVSLQQFDVGKILGIRRLAA